MKAPNSPKLSILMSSLFDGVISIPYQKYYRGTISLNSYRHFVKTKATAAR